jgi:hypothetical protein
MVPPTQIVSWKNELLGRAAEIFGNEPRGERCVQFARLHQSLALQRCRASLSRGRSELPYWIPRRRVFRCAECRPARFRTHHGAPVVHQFTHVFTGCAQSRSAHQLQGHVCRRARYTKQCAHTCPAPGGAPAFALTTVSTSFGMSELIALTCFLSQTPTSNAAALGPTTSVRWKVISRS